MAKRKTKGKARRTAQRRATTKVAFEEKCREMLFARLENKDAEKDEIFKLIRAYCELKKTGDARAVSKSSAKRRDSTPTPKSRAVTDKELSGVVKGLYGIEI